MFLLERVHASKPTIVLMKRQDGYRLEQEGRATEEGTRTPPTTRPPQSARAEEPETRDQGNHGGRCYRYPRICATSLWSTWRPTGAARLWECRRVSTFLEPAVHGLPLSVSTAT